MLAPKVTCPIGHENPANQSFCGHCGAPLAPARMCAHGHQIPARERFCGQCGMPPATPGLSTPGPATPSQARGTANSANGQRRRTVSTVAGAAAAVVSIGSLGPWLNIMMVTLNGLDAWFGQATLTLGVACCIALLVESYSAATPARAQWAAPLASAVAVAGVACATITVPLLIRMMTIPKDDVFVTEVGVGIQWGLWLVVAGSAVLFASGWAAVLQTARDTERSFSATQSGTTWAWTWLVVALLASATIVLWGFFYYGSNWEGGIG